MINFVGVDITGIVLSTYITNALADNTSKIKNDSIVFFKNLKTIWAKGTFYTCTPAISLKLENYSISGVTGSVEANDTILQAILKLQVQVSAADTNQKIKVDSTTFDNDDVIDLVAGNNVSITPATTGNGAPKITISATDTTYESKSAANEGIDLSLVTTGEKYTWNNKLDALTNPVTRPGNDALTADRIVLGSGNNTVKSSAFGITTNTVDSSSDNTTVPTSKAVWNAISELPKAMIFRGTLGTSGTITSLPTAAAGVEGDVYKVITANTYNSTSALVGDIFICGKIGDSYQWILVPKDTDTDTWRGIKVDGTKFLGSAISTGNVDFVAGSNVTLTTDSTNGTITIAATDTTYSNVAEASNGQNVSLVTTGDKYNWNHMLDWEELS